MGLSPATMRQAYGINLTNFAGLPGDGTGMTIAIVDAFSDPNIASDLAAFDSYYSINAPPSFNLLNENGAASPLPSAAPIGSWGIETSLDVEWAHVIAPNAGIDLIETNSANFSDLLSGVDAASSIPGICTVSMSWSIPEFYSESSDDSDFITPSGHTGITYVADTGDYGAYYPGYPVLDAVYPASSPNVLAVGATSLTTNNGAYVSESGWGNGSSSYSAGGSGGGISSQSAQPLYQTGAVTQSTTKRCTPDVSMDGDPNTGAAVYDSYDDNPSTPWTEIGGTSLATPMWAAVIALADQGRVHNGLQTLDGATQTLPMLYALPSSDFHDITTGNNGYAAGPGYDLVTGLGTPIVNLLAPALAGYSTASTTTAVTTSNSSPSYGQSIIFTATVTLASGSGETGTVQFQIDGSNVGNAVNISGGTATFTTSTLAAGTHSVVAIYSGDSSFAGSTSTTFTQNVLKAATTTVVTSNATSPIYGQSVTLTATVSPTTGSGETGSVQFKVDGSNVGNAVNVSNNIATISLSNIGAGSNTVVATYSGDGNFNSSTSSTFTQTVSTASLSITANSDSKTYGQTKTYGPGSTAFLSSGLQNNETIGTVTLTASGGAAANASAGTYSLTPSAAAGGTFNASDYSITYNAGTLTVNRLALTVTATGVNKVYDGGITAVVTLSDNRLAGDIVSDSYSSAVFADPNAGVGKTVSVSGISISGPEAGDYLLQNTTAGTTANITPSATTTLVTSSSTSPTYGQSITFTATVTPASGSGETGSVQFQIDGSNVGGAMNLSGGTATYTTSALAVGNHSVIAIYSGDGNFNTSTSSAYTQTVTAPPSPLNLIGSAYLELDATTPGQLDVWTGTTNTGTPTDTYPLSQVSSITDSGGGGNVTLTVNFSNGNPLGSVTPGVTFDNTNHTDALVIVGDNHGDTYNATSGQVIVSGGAQPAFNAVSISFDSTISESIQAGTGPDVLAVNGSTTLTYTAPTGGSNPTAQLSSLSIGSGSRVLFTSPGTSRALLELSSAPNWAGQLDLQSNDLLIHGGASAFGVVNNLLTSGFNKGTWTGQGITSSSAASEGSHLAALGTILNDQNGTAVFTSNNLFDGVAPAATDVLVRYTYYGDANLDGRVDGSDYSDIDNGFLNNRTLSGWFNGDFNYDGSINGSDYTLIDNAFNDQASPLGSVASVVETRPVREIATALPAAMLFQSETPITFGNSPEDNFEHSLQTQDVVDKLQSVFAPSTQL